MYLLRAQHHLSRNLANHKLRVVVDEKGRDYGACAQSNSCIPDVSVPVGQLSDVISYLEKYRTEMNQHNLVPPQSLRFSLFLE